MKGLFKTQKSFTSENGKILRIGDTITFVYDNMCQITGKVMDLTDDSIMMLTMNDQDIIVPYDSIVDNSLHHVA